MEKTDTSKIDISKIVHNQNFKIVVYGTIFMIYLNIIEAHCHIGSHKSNDGNYASITNGWLLF